MMNNNTNNNIPDEVLELIPWYAIGNLSVDDQAYFDNALSVYPLLKELVKQELHIVETVSEDKALLDMSAITNQDERLKSVFNMIDAAVTETKVQPKTPSMLDKVKTLISSLIPNSSSQYVPIAGLGVLVLSVAVLTAFVTPIFTESNEFIPASAVPNNINQNQNTIATLNSELLIGFNGTSRKGLDLVCWRIILI